MAGLKTILIWTEDIIPGCKYMRDNKDRLDLLGQILQTGYKIKVHKHAESPAHQGTVLSPFSVMYRERSHNTQLTLQLLHNAQQMTAKEQLEAANILLEEHDIYLEKAE